jgi:hypothetical protein
MSFFNKKLSPIENVTKISVFPKIGSLVLKKEDKLIVFSPSYLLGKHGNTSKEVASKFMDLRTASHLLELIDHNISSRHLSGSKIEIKEINYGADVGFDSLYKIPRDLIGILPIEDIRGNNIQTLYVAKGKIPHTKLLNIILVPFDPKYGQGVDNLFKEKYQWIGFEHFKEIYAILTIYPGRYAPPMTDYSFWHKHALMKEI